MQSVSVYTAGIPAEYGRKMGGVIEVNTLQDAQAGFHGNLVLSGGSFGGVTTVCAGAIRLGQERAGRECQRQVESRIRWSRRITRTQARWEILRCTMSVTPRRATV